MKALIQRVNRGRVTVLGRETGAIGAGLVILLGVMPEDDERIAEYLADRCAGLRIFEDEQGKMNKSLLDIGGSALVISQFTLCADVSAGRRPSFNSAAHPEKANPLYEHFKAALAQSATADLSSNLSRVAVFSVITCLYSAYLTNIVASS